MIVCLSVKLLSVPVSFQENQFLSLSFISFIFFLCHAGGPPDSWERGESCPCNEEGWPEAILMLDIGALYHSPLSS